MLVNLAICAVPLDETRQASKYTSDADTANPRGATEGCFHTARVDTQETGRAHGGDRVEALQWKSFDERIFKLPGGRFGLVVDNNDDVNA